MQTTLTRPVNYLVDLLRIYASDVNPLKQAFSVPDCVRSLGRFEKRAELESPGWLLRRREIASAQTLGRPRHA